METTKDNLLGSLVDSLNQYLFVLFDGVPLVDMPVLFIFWVAIGSFIMAIPSVLTIIYSSYSEETSTVKALKFFISAIWFFVVFFFVVAPVTQVNHMKECRIINAEVNKQIIQLDECRHRDNYYDDFGEWKIDGVHNGK
jgi:hypothetical protein